MADARIVVDPGAVIGRIDERIFGGFIEHMGRAVYGGIYEPAHPTADAGGWRRDVLDLVRSLGVTIVRYPGGNFVSGYEWEDGVGPRATRPVRRDEAWHAVEPNLVGTDDFLDWARLAGVAPMLAVNLGTRGSEAARALVEYCNGSTDTREGSRRAANGHLEPYQVRVWCLGNEMDGPWQIGAKSAPDYGRLAFETGVAMRRADPTIELVACGSSGAAMPTFGSWEETVLDLAWDVIDHISVHTYLDPGEHGSVEAYLAAPSQLDDMLSTVAAIVDRVGASKGSDKAIGLSVDEWNVWRLSEFQASESGVAAGPYRRAPALAEDRADVADALVVGGLLLALLRHADRVRMACVAQLVNVIPLIRTVDGGPAWLNATAHPFADVARWARSGTVVRVMVDVPPETVDAVAVWDAATASATIFAINRSVRPLDVEFDVASDGDADGGLEMTVRTELAAPDLRASNTAEEPTRVAPRPVDPSVWRGGGRLMARLSPRSWNVVGVRTPRPPGP